MDKLTAIKIKYDDTHYSNEIPIGVAAQNVDWDTTHSLVEILGVVDTSPGQDIQSQIDNLRQNGIPSYTNLQDHGKALVVNNTSGISWKTVEGGGSDLPSYTSSDADKILAVNYNDYSGVVSLEWKKDELKLYKDNSFQDADGLYTDINGQNLFAHAYKTLSGNTHNSFNDALSAANTLYHQMLEPFQTIKIRETNVVNGKYTYSIHIINELVLTYNPGAGSVLLYYTTIEDNKIEKTYLVAYNVAIVGDAEVGSSIVG